MYIAPMNDGNGNDDEDLDDEPEGSPGDLVRVGIYLDGPRENGKAIPPEWVEWSQDQRNEFIDDMKRELLLSIAFDVDGARYTQEPEIPPQR